MIQTGTIEMGNGRTPYQYINLLGEGSYGQVWKAENLITGDFVAIKAFKNRYKNKKDLSDSSMERLQEQIFDNVKHEIEALKKLSSVCEDYAVCYYDTFKTKDGIRIVEEFISGYTLKEYMRRVPAEKRKREYIDYLIVGLYKLHQLGVAHQDIKEENIMISNDGDVKYVDWGLSCLQDYYVKCGSSGTAYTAPPEREYFGSFDYDANLKEAQQHDVWSLSIVLFDYISFLQTTSSKIYYSGEYSSRISKILNKMSPYNMSTQQINSLLQSSISDILLRDILYKLMVRNESKRLENLKECVDLILLKDYRSEDELYDFRTLNLESGDMSPLGSSFMYPRVYHKTPLPENTPPVVYPRVYRKTPLPENTPPVVYPRVYRKTPQKETAQTLNDRFYSPSIYKRLHESSDDEPDFLPTKL